MKGKSDRENDPLWRVHNGRRVKYPKSERPKTFPRKIHTRINMGHGCMSLGESQIIHFNQYMKL